MAKTADVQQAIWSDPWFLDLSPEGKLLYFWSITTAHGNLAGLFTVGRQMIQFETGLSPARFEKAVRDCNPKLYYRADSGVMWVVGRAKNVRSKTTQIAKSIARTVEECPEKDFQQAFLAKYGSEKWLLDAFSDSALEVDNSEPHLNLNEVPSISRSPSIKEVGGSGGKKIDPEALPSDFDPSLIPVVDACLPILRRVAEAKGAKPVHRLPLAKAIAAMPDRNHVLSAGELEHWCLHGRGESRTQKDIVATFRNFLKNADPVARPTERQRPSVDYDAKTEVWAA